MLKIIIVMVVSVVALALGFVALNNNSANPNQTKQLSLAPSADQGNISSPPVSFSSSDPVLITAGVSSPKGMDVFQTTDFLTRNGMNFFDYSQDWRDIEPSPGQYDLQNTITNPLIFIPQICLGSPYLCRADSVKGVLLVIKMIDSNVRVMPADLQNKPFDDLEVKQRWLTMLHAIAQQPSTKKITHILLGNEVDSYFSAHPNELGGFMTLLKASIDQIHQEMPGVKVGTITTFDSLNNNPQLFQTLTQYSDFVDYTYYPINGISRICSPVGGCPKGWQMRPVSEVPADLNKMVQAAGSKPFGFTEIGYSASPLNSSSEDQQSNFVTTVFNTLDQYHKQNRIVFISWSSFADYSPDFCDSYAASQGIIASPEFCAFLDNLGLRTYADNQPRKAWYTFVSEVAKWIGAAGTP